MESDLPSIASTVLDRIASGESSGLGYNELYGGGTFDDSSDHPRQKFDLGNGTYTDAAGRYQFLSRTWDQEARKLGLTNFGPKSQDLAAWDLASSTYKQQTGKDLATDATNGSVDWKALAGVWPSLGSASASPSPSAVPAPVAPTPDASPSPRPDMAQLLQLLSSHLQFTPVDYDPFAVMPGASQ